MRARMVDWLAITAALLILIALTQPQLLAVDLHKISLITLGGVTGYWLDRGLFPYGRPDRVDTKTSAGVSLFGVAMMRRAIIVAACVIGAALGA